LSVQSKPEYLHLDMIFNIVGEKTAVTYYDGLPTAFQEYLDKAGYDLIKIEEAGVFKHFCNLQALGNKKVISLATNIKVNQALRDRGFTVFELNSTEILKTGGGPHCMTFPVRRT
ncbi:MAG: arginine deiminase family protein, partial [Psychromonas sp.]